MYKTENIFTDDLRVGSFSCLSVNDNVESAI